jgi:hypothetical protein
LPELLIREANSMRMEDVKSAIRRHDTRKLEDAFSALVNWPYNEPIVDVQDAFALMTLLARLTFALRDDVYFMPTPTCERIRKATGKIVFAYKDGVEAVTDHRDYWRALFISYFNERAFGRAPTPSRPPEQSKTFSALPMR